MSMHLQCRAATGATWLALALQTGLAAQPAQASPEMATKAGCITCHAVDKKLIGPSYRDIAAKYKGKADAAALMAGRIRNGSAGVWGPVPMPATDKAKLSDADLKAVVGWLLKTP